jgi:hypothetical protein
MPELAMTVISEEKKQWYGTDLMSPYHSSGRDAQNYLRAMRFFE